MPRYHLSIDYGRGGEETIEAASWDDARRQAEEWVRGGSWGDAEGRIEEALHIECIITDEAGEEDGVEVEIPADAPEEDEDEDDEFPALHEDD